MVNSSHERFVLHPSVTALWWLSGTRQENAERLYQRMRAGVASVVIVEGIESFIIRELLRGLRAGARYVNLRGGNLSSDVQTEIAELESQRAVFSYPRAGLREGSWTLAQALDIDVYDAQCVLLAEAM